jgi:hypothetical protein
MAAKGEGECMLIKTPGAKCRALINRSDRKGKLQPSAASQPKGEGADASLYARQEIGRGIEVTS